MIVGLYVRTYDWMTDSEYRYPITSEQCWKCGRPNPDLAHAVHEYVAAVLGAELERRVLAAIAEHEAAHGCARPGWASSCPDVFALWDLLPEAMQPVAIA